ncbi:MAG TPA: transposase [Gammaproteobacteria bacterium]
MPRVTMPGITLHVVQRGHNRARAFFDREDYFHYLDLLTTAAARYETRVHAYVLMTNHVHLLLTQGRPNGVSLTLQYVAGIYSRRINARYGRTGSLWEGRFKSSPIDSDRYCLACYRYIELNPVRAGITKRPDDYRWSSYRVNSTGAPSVLITPHPTYDSLGITPRGRAERYRGLVQDALPESLLQDLRESVRKGLPTGSDDFRRQVETALKRPLGSGRRGRPPKRRPQKGADE